MNSSEVEKQYLSAVDRRISRKTGAGLDGQEYGTVAVDPAWEAAMLDAPAYPLAQPLQDPVTGKPYFMAGYDALGDPDVILR